MGVVGAQAIEQFENLIEHFVGVGAVAIDLVDHHDRVQPCRKCFLRDETRLRHRPIHGIYQQQYRVDHRQNALHLAAEVSMPWGIDDIDAVVLPGDGRVLGQNRDAAFLLKHVRIHHSFSDMTRIDRTGLRQEPVHQGSFAMVDMGDDRDVA